MASHLQHIRKHMDFSHNLGKGGLSSAPESWHRWHRRCQTNHIWLDKMRFRWKNIGHIMARAKKSCLTLTWLLDTLSNDYWTHCPMIIGQIVQWLLDKLSNIYRTEYKVSKESPFTHFSWIWIGLKIALNYVMILQDENYVFFVAFKKIRYTCFVVQISSQKAVVSDNKKFWTPASGIYW